jgi:hypothetical protein
MDVVFGPGDAGIDQRLGEPRADGEARVQGIERILERELRNAADHREQSSKVRASTSDRRPASNRSWADFL